MKQINIKNDCLVKGKLAKAGEKYTEDQLKKKFKCKPSDITTLISTGNAFAEEVVNVTIEEPVKEVKADDTKPSKSASK